MSMNPAGERLAGPRTHQCVQSLRAGVVTHSSGLILIFEEPRSVTGVRVVVGTMLQGGSPCGYYFPIQLGSMWSPISAGMTSKLIGSF